MKNIWLVIFCTISTVGFAQRTTVKGVLKDTTSQVAIAFANITNLTNGKTYISNADGRFAIEVQEGDIISYSFIGYHFDTMHITAQSLQGPGLQLWLKPLVNTLSEVTVTAKGYSPYQLDSIERRKEFLAHTGALKKTVGSANSGAGIALNIDRFSKRERIKRNAYHFFDVNEQQEYINYRFNNTLVNEYTGLQGDTLQLFMQRFRPDNDWLRQHLSNEDIKYYINEGLKTFYNRQ